jgi:hypothetical protein
MNTQRLFISGTLPMSKDKAQSIVDAGRRVVLHLWGEGPYTATITATATGLEYTKELLLPGAAPHGRPRVDARVV